VDLKPFCFRRRLHINAAGIADDRKEPLFRAAIGKTNETRAGAMSRTDV
jgi:hypothetical protein